MSLIAQLAALAQGPHPLRIEIHTKDTDTLQVSLLPAKPLASESDLAAGPSGPLVRVLTQPIAFVLPARAEDLDQQLSAALAELESTRTGLAGDLARFQADAAAARKAAQETAAKKSAAPAKAAASVAPAARPAAPATKPTAPEPATPARAQEAAPATSDAEEPAEAGSATPDDDAPGLFD